MYIFFLGKYSPPHNISHIYSGMTNTLRTHGGTVIQSTGTDDGDNVHKTGRAWQKREDKTDVEYLLDGADAFVIEQHASSREVGYVVNIAVLSKNPILYLSPRYAGLSEYGKFLRQKNYPNLKIAFYHPLNIGTILKRFVAMCSEYRTPENITTKFTLRLTKEIDEYLTWKCQRLRQAKADFLRDVVLRYSMENDKEYQAKRQKMHAAAGSTSSRF